MHLRTNLRTQLALAYITINITETFEDRANVNINGLYKVVHGLSIAAKMYDLEWPMSEIQGHWFIKCHKNDEIHLSNDSDACWVSGCTISIRPRYACAVHLLTYLHSWLGAYKTGNISETDEDRAKATIDSQ